MPDPSDHLETVGDLAARLHALGLTPILVGGMALVVLGSRRVTRDFDFLMSAPGDHLAEVYSPDLIVAAIRQVAQGLASLSPAVARSLIDHVAGGRSTNRQAAARATLAELSARELEVAVQVSQGLSNAQIGAALFLSEATVKAHVSRLLTKLHLNNRVQIAILIHDARLPL